MSPKNLEPPTTANKPLRLCLFKYLRFLLQPLLMKSINLLFTSQSIHIEKYDKYNNYKRMLT